MATIKVKIENNEYTDKFNNINVPSNQTILESVVYVDDDNELNQFEITNDCKWIKLKKVRNNVTIIVEKNVSLKERVGTLIFTHNLDNNVYVRLAIVQSAADYELGIRIETEDESVNTVVGEGYYNVWFNTLLDKNTPEKESVTVYVAARGGYADFGIKPPIEYVRNAGEGNIEVNTTVGTWPNSVNGILQDNYYMTVNDGGLNIHKSSNTKMEITNYGKISMYDKAIYVTKLYHVNDPNKSIELHIGYINSNENNGSGFELNDDDQRD